jgi:hypothetical protein
MNDLPKTTSGLVIHSAIYVLSNLPTVLRVELPPVSYDMLFRDPHDGCARHDDVWGG